MKKLELYRNRDMEEKLLCRIRDSAGRRYGSDIPEDVKERMETEIRHIFENGNGILLAVADRLAEFSENRGFPVSFRGCFCNLFVAYLLGMVPEDPIEYGLPWELCLGLDGGMKLSVDMNLADEVFGEVRDFLAGQLTDCRLVFEQMDESASCLKVLLVPEGWSEEEPYGHFHLFGLKWLGDIGRCMRQTKEDFHEINVTEKALIHASYGPMSVDIPEFESELFRHMAMLLHPYTLEELAKIVGMGHGMNVWLSPQREYCESAGEPFGLITDLIGTREDVYHACIEHGIGREDAFYITEQVRKGHMNRLPERYARMVRDAGFSELFQDTIAEVKYLFSKGQCLNYAHWALVLLWYKLVTM